MALGTAVTRALAFAALGGTVGAACLAAAYAARPGLVLDMDRDLPRLASGFHPVEHHLDETFAWTTGHAAVVLRGADRRSVWTCSVRVRGGRPPGFPQPAVELAVDGVTVTTIAATNEYQNAEVTAPARLRRPGLRFSVASAPTFVPGEADPRELGVQVDRLACRPAEGTLALPPGAALRAAALAGAIFGAALALIAGATSWGAIGGLLVLLVGQAVALSSGPAPYSDYLRGVPWIAFWVAGPLALGLAIVARWRARPVTGTARFVVALTAGALFLQLLALLHPSKALVDALFHAHRFDWVLAGRYLFTQPMPDGVQFPYAIGLYVFAAPWSAVTRDHVTLLRVVVLAAHAVAGALLYLLVVRAWGDRVTGALAVALFHLLPLPYVVIGNANLTYAFGQSAAFVTLAAATAWPLRPRNVGLWAAVFLLGTLAFLSHVGIFPLLLVTLVALAALYHWRGGPLLRPAARAVALAATLAAVTSVAVYYGRFGEAYETLDRVRLRAVAGVQRAAPAESPAEAAPADERGLEVAGAPLHRRVAGAAALGVRAFGWPIVLLGMVGLGRLWAGGARDRLGLLLIAVGLTGVAFVAFALATPVEARFQRYTDEFIDRVHYSMAPLGVVLAARGGAWVWAGGSLLVRVGAAGLLLWAALVGVQAWLTWIR
jgi:hypothetical protein